MKFQLVLSTGGMYEKKYFSITMYFISIDQHFLYKQFVSSVNNTVFVWYSKCGGGILDKIKSSISNMTRVVFSIPLWHPLRWIIRLSVLMDLPYLPCPYLLRRRKNLPSKQSSLYHLSDSYCIIILSFTLLWMVMSLYFFSFYVLYYTMTCNCHYTIQSCVLSSVFVTLFW